MTAMPEGAQKSEDGNWWWDDSAQQWKPTDQQGQQHQQGQGGEHGDGQQHQVDWTRYQALGPLFQAYSIDEYLQLVNVDPQVLHTEAGTELGQQIDNEFQALRQAAGDPAQPNVQQLLPLLQQGSQGTPFVELVKQLDQKLKDAGDSNADQMERFAQQLEQDVNQLQQDTGGGY